MRLSNYMKFDVCRSCANREISPRCACFFREDHQLAQGCFPWDCLHVIHEEQFWDDKKIKKEARSKYSATGGCPYSHASRFEPGLYGCPKYNKDNTGEFCPYGVRTITVHKPWTDREDEICKDGDTYVFDPSSDLKFKSHEWVVWGTLLKKECEAKGIHCLREFVAAYSPEAIKGMKGIRDYKYDQLLEHIAVYGYEATDDGWRKRTVEEQREWFARKTLGHDVWLAKREAQRREEKRQKRLQKERVKHDNKEVK